MSNAFILTGNNASGDDITQNSEYSYEDNVLTILSGGTYKITMNTDKGISSTDSDRIEVKADGDVTLTITDINVTSSVDAALRADSGNLTLILDGDNYLTSDTTNYEALSKTSGDNTLKITSIEGDNSTTGSLTATGGYYGAGIGGGYGASGVNIEIAGGTITAKSGYYGAGIGGGITGSGSNITISGGNVTASSTRGAGIGGGYYGSGSNITVGGGNISASSTDGAGIGGGRAGSGSDITINDGFVYASSSGGYAAGIGGGYGSSGTNIVIYGGTITAEGAYSIGDAYNYTGTANAPIINGGSVKALDGLSANAVNSSGTTLYLYKFDNAIEGNTIAVNGKIYVKSVVYHSSDDTTQYIFITADDAGSIVEYLLGDVNDDGTVDKIDAALVLKHVSEISELTEQKQLAASDYNTDGSIDMTDVVGILAA